MPVVINPMDSKMVLCLQTGTDADGQAIISKKNYSKVKAEVTNEDFYEVASVICGLQIYPVQDVYRDNLMTVEQA